MKIFEFLFEKKFVKVALTRLVSGVCQRHLLSHLGLQGPAGSSLKASATLNWLNRRTLPAATGIRTQATGLFVLPANSI